MAGHVEDEWAAYQTQEVRSAYSVQLREFAEQLMVEGDMASAELNLYLSESYSKPSK